MIWSISHWHALMTFKRIRPCLSTNIMHPPQFEKFTRQFRKVTKMPTCRVRRKVRNVVNALTTIQNGISRSDGRLFGRIAALPPLPASFDPLRERACSNAYDIRRTLLITGVLSIIWVTAVLTYSTAWKHRSGFQQPLCGCFVHLYILHHRFVDRYSCRSTKIKHLDMHTHIGYFVK